jgi:hypothetical protein
MVKLNQQEIRYKSHSNGMETPPPPAAWDRIEASLNAAQRNKFIALWWRSAAAAVILILISIGAWNFFDQRTDSSALLISKTEITSVQTDSDLNSRETNTSNAPILPQENNLTNVALSEATHERGVQTTTFTGSSDKAEDIHTPFSHKKIASTKRLSFIPSVPLFTTRKTEVKKLIAQNGHDQWKNQFNVTASLFPETREHSASARKVQIGGAFSPTYSFRQTSGGQDYSTAASNGNFSEKGLTSNSIGLNLNVQMNKKWAVESGVRFARLGQEVHAGVSSEKVYALNSETESFGNVSLKRFSLNNSMGDINNAHKANSFQNDEFSFGDIPKTMVVDFRMDEATGNGRMEQHLDYIEVPVTLRYYFVNRNVKLSLSAGVSTNWLIGNNAYLTENGDRQKIGETNGLSAMNWSSHAGVAFSVPVFGPLSFRMEPRINYFLTEINENFPVKYKPYSFGIYSGIQYTFGE